ncbi:CRISPR-associated protein Cas6 [Desulfosporosinus sp. Tol-M]|nr:CRISPR-associated protein Cas6 [Desulfosporosinus sp. Tol-M]
MHLEIYFKPLKKPGVLPIHYNYLVQAAIYNSIDSKLANFLHEKGYVDGSRTFKLFSFSLLQGAYQMDRVRKTIAFEREIQLTVSSPLPKFCQSLVSILLTKGGLRLGALELEIDKVKVRQFRVKENQVNIRTLSPAVLYSTLLRPDGRKYTVFFQPGEPDYTRLFNENLRKKYRALFEKEEPTGAIEVRPLGLQRMRIINYKDTVIKGYWGKLFLNGPKELLQLAIDGGIGSKNSQGFGCVEVEER